MRNRIQLLLALSAAGVVICVALALVDPRRGARRVIHVSPASPELSSPLTSTARDRPSTRARVGATVAAGLGVALVAGVPSGLVVAAAVLAALARPSARVLLTAGSVGALALAGIYTAGQQYRHPYLAQFEWPTRFYTAHVLAWLAVGLLAADTLVDLVRRRRADR